MNFVRASVVFVVVAVAVGGVSSNPLSGEEKFLQDINKENVSLSDFTIKDLEWLTKSKEALVQVTHCLEQRRRLCKNRAAKRMAKELRTLLRQRKCNSCVKDKKAFLAQRKLITETLNVVQTEHFDQYRQLFPTLASLVI